MHELSKGTFSIRGNKLVCIESSSTTYMNSKTNLLTKKTEFSNLRCDGIKLSNLLHSF